MSLGLLVQVVACSGDCGGGSSGTDQGPGDVVWIAEGEGEANAEPLWTLYPGYRQLRVDNVASFRTFGQQSYDTVLGAPIEFHGQTLMSLGNAAWEEFYYRGYPSEPAYWKLITQSESADIWWAGTPRRGLFAERLLIVPSTVRVGMKWESRVDGATVLSGEVVAREVQDTMFGERAVWTIALLEHFADGRTQATYSAQFIEGRGPASFAPFIHDQHAADTRDYLVIHPLEEVVPTPELATIELEALNGGEPVGSGSLTRHVSAYPDPEAEGTLIISLIGRRDFAGGYGPEEAEGRFACFRLESDDSIETTNEICDFASAWTFKPDGSGLRNATTAQGAPAPPSSTCTDCPPAVMQGIFVTPENRFAALATSQTHPRRPDGLWVVDTDDWPIPVEFQGWIPIDFASPGTLDVTNSVNNPTYPLHIEAAPDGDLRLLRPLPRMHFAHYEATAGRTTAFEAYPRTGSYNVNNFHGGRTITTASLDGKVETLHLLEEGIGVRTLGVVNVPEGEFLTGAIEHDGELLVLTQRGFEGIDLWYRDGPVDFSYPTNFGEVMAYRAALPDVVPQAPADIWGLTGARSGEDALICWPTPAQSLEQDWTLGGAPAPALLSADGRCALLLRASELDEPTRPSSWTVEGSVPGTGRVAIGGLHAARDMWPFADEIGAYGASIAPVSGGGFVDSRGFEVDASTARSRYNNHLFEFVSPEWYNVSLIFQGGPDVAGHGYWVVRGGRELGDTHLVPALLSTSGLIELSAVDFSVLGTLLTASEGGGALMLSHPNGSSDFVDGVRAIRPGGTVATLPAPSYGAVDFRLADDTTCGVSNFDDSLWCTSPAGVESAIGLPTGDTAAAMVRPGDGVYWPAQAVSAEQAILLERYAGGAIEQVSADLADLGLPQQAVDVQWRQWINGNIVGAVNSADGGLLLQVEDGVISKVECDGPVDDIVRVLHDSTGVAPYSAGMLVDVEGGKRIFPGPGCELF